MTFYIVDSHWRHQNHEWTHMELCSKQMWNSSKYVSSFRFLKVATLCFVDSSAALAHSQWASWFSHLKWFSLHRCDLSEFMCGICCLLNGDGTEVRLVHSWQPYLTTDDDWLILAIIITKQRVATLKNLKYKTSFELFHFFLFTA